MTSPQKYLTDTNKMSSLLFNLSENECKDNFHNISRESLCIVYQQFIDSQEHAPSCADISHHLVEEDKARLNRGHYSDLFSDTDKQFEITLLYYSITKVQQVLQEERSKNMYFKNLIIYHLTSYSKSKFLRTNLTCVGSGESE